MENTKIHVIEQLISLSKSKSFITIDEIINCVTTSDLPLDDLERICESLLDEGIIIRSDMAGMDFDEEVDDISIDKSHIDYERVYRRIIKIDSTLKAYVFEIKKIQPPQKNEEKTLLIQAREGNEYARSRLIKMFLKVVLRMALWYYDKYSLPLKETIQDGNLGLLLALEKIPLTNGVRFSTYAPWWIRRSIMRSASIEFCDNFYVPVHIKDILFRLVEIRNKHSCNECVDGKICPSLKEKIFLKLNLDEKEIQTYMNYMSEPISIEECIFELGQEELFCDDGEQQDDLNQRLSDSCRSEKILQVFSDLKPRESDVLMRRWGFGKYNPMTLEEISDDYQVTRERIRQIETNAKEKLKRLLSTSLVSDTIIY